jgi:hypothetical protein
MMDGALSGEKEDTESHAEVPALHVFRVIGVYSRCSGGIQPKPIKHPLARGGAALETTE